MSASRPDPKQRAPFEVWPIDAAPDALSCLVPSGFKADWIVVSRDGASVRDREQLLEMLQGRAVRQTRVRRKLLYFLRLS